MNYEVIISANGASANQVQEAAAKFRQGLEAALGGASQVEVCFKAHAKSRDGRGPLTPQEDHEAASWMRAYNAAEAKTKAALGRQDIGILVRLA